VGGGSTTLAWTPPTTNIDGSPLSDLNGYRLYYGLSPTTLSNVINVPAGVVSQQVSGLSSGLYYFAVTALNSANMESGYSDVVFRTIL
jgi:hypothetical protein